MITVRTPNDIREYKEKLVAGLTARQIICIIALAAVCAPIIIFGRAYFSADALSYICIGVAIPIGLIGFYKIDNMPFERFFKAMLKFNRSKRELVFTAQSAVKVPVEEPIKPKIAEKRSIERAVIFDEADELITIPEADEKLVTVKYGGRKPPKKKKEKKPSRKRRAEDKLLERADDILKKRTDDPFYIFTKKEHKVLRRAAELKEKRRKEEVKEKSVPKKAENKRAAKRKVSQKSTLPKTVQEALPYIADYQQGIFELTAGEYSKLYIIEDLNYQTATQDKQTQIFAMYAEFLNSFDESANINIYIDNRVVSKAEQERRIFYPMTGDDFDKHREEYNKIMETQMEVGRNEMVQAKYISVTIKSDTFAEASSRFRKVDMQVEDGIKNLGSLARPLSTDERLEILHDKLRKGHEGEFRVDFDFLEKQGISSKDYIAPAYIAWNRKYFMIDDEYYRCMYLNNLPAEMSDDFFGDLVDNNFPLTATICIDPIPQHVSLKLVDKNKLGMEANIIEAQKKAVRAGYSAEIAVHHKLKANYESALELSDDLRKRSQKMFFVSVLLMFSAPSLEELDRRESTLCSKARKITAQLQTLTQRQQDGFAICLPLGVPSKLAVDRALTSESTAVFIPFSCQELFQVGGFYYGLNGVSRNLILLDRTKLPTPSGFVLGMSGSGKSFAVKREMLNVLLRDSTTPLLIIDPENEYTNFVKHFGGECIKISANSDSYINPMEMSPDYGLDEDDNPETVDIEVKKDKALRRKSDYLLSIINRMLQPDGGNTSLTPQQKTFIDSCITECYKEYLASDFDRDKLPSLKELQAIFDSRKGESDDARLVAEGTAYFTTGSMDVFSHQSNVDLNNRIVCFGIRELGDQLRQIALQIVLDFIWNKMTENSGKKTRTYCYADEIHVLFKNRDSASFLQQLYKRGRKYGLVITGITQDIGDLLKSEEGCGMVYNSDFLLLLRQAPENLRTLAPRLNLSEAQCSELTTAAPGSGILKAGSVVVPFRDKFPKTSYLYKLISTNFNELEKEKAGETVKNGAA